MGRSLRASEEGLRRVEAARIKKKWNKQDEAWWGLAGVGKETLKRFRNGEAIDKEKFQAICEAVGVNHQEVIVSSRCFWGTSPDVDFFCGRKEELNTLTQWIIQDKCRLISITAMGGMGKKLSS
ncbi:MAG: hypothetical protein HC930_18125 [Hydrococcus sp. SU_1_0]|nr:hypothetical protein [Hydrococcus sp. SU_1_0]